MSRRLHHVGFAVASIADSIRGYQDQFGMSWNGEIFHDPVQRVRVTFLASAVPGEPLFELLEPAAENSPVDRFLAAGGSMHHLCYEVDDLAQALQQARSLGALIARTPRPAVAFGGRRIAWIKTKEGILTELLEGAPAA